MAYTKQQIKNLCKGRTEEQKVVIKYFHPAGGCLSSGIPDSTYDQIVSEKIRSLNAKKRALSKIGLDETQVNEIEPVHFEGYHFDKAYAKKGLDNNWRSSAYQITWIFFSSTQVYAYQYTFNTDCDEKNERTEEYFYKDITSFSTSSETIEKEVPDKKTCQGKQLYYRRNVEHDEFLLVVPGTKMECSMQKSNYTEQAIQGMKAKLREKKG